MDEEELLEYENQIYRLTHAEPLSTAVTEQIYTEEGAVEGCYRVPPAPTYG
jgi:phenolic acid decarboxylase